jgi:mannose-6-phosphate isomerase-like protein (cupin superfamily)
VHATDRDDDATVVVSPPDDGDRIELTPLETMRVTLHGSSAAQRLEVIKLVVRPGGGPPLHLHRRGDEIFYVLSGTLPVRVGAQTVEAAPGALGHVPRGMAHAVLRHRSAQEPAPATQRLSWPRRRALYGRRHANTHHLDGVCVNDPPASTPTRGDRCGSLPAGGPQNVLAATVHWACRQPGLTSTVSVGGPSMGITVCETVLGSKPTGATRSRLLPSRGRILGAQIDPTTSRRRSMTRPSSGAGPTRPHQHRDTDPWRR